jgi:hypothetical protein
MYRTYRAGFAKNNDPSKSKNSLKIHYIGLKITIPSKNKCAFGLKINHLYTHIYWTKNKYCPSPSPSPQ